MLDDRPPIEGDTAIDFDALSLRWEEDEQKVIQIAEEAYNSSTDYLRANYTKQIEKNISNFRSRHPAGSKYNSEAYAARSRLFRPKSRSIVRRSEAAFAEAMFATSDVVTVNAEDQANKEQDQAAIVWQKILNRRLKYDIKWFLTACGAYQETKVYGVVISRQDWEREEITITPESVDEITQAIIPAQTKVITNRPRCELIEWENFRFDPAAKWYDPIGTSPYLIELMPMYVGDVLDMMQRIDPETGEPEWTEYTREEILAYGRLPEEKYNTVKTTREGNRTNPNDVDHAVREFETVWILRYFIKKEGEDYEFYTLSTRKLLTKPKPTTNILGRHTYRIGISSIEAHRCIPSGDVEMNQDLQSEANDIANQRRDNVKLALNRGKYVQRERNVDLLTLKRSYPGRIVMTDDINAIRDESFNDVTGSSYQEEDRLNTDMDDLLGGFSAGSVMSNRKLNETVGGMNQIAQSGNSVQGYSVRTFIETWAEPVLDDLIKLIQYYESDETIQKYASSVGAQIETRDQLMKDLTATASVGFGMLDPKQRSQAVFQTLTAITKAAPWASQGLDIHCVAQELFGPLGYRDGSKFFGNLKEGPPQPQPDPKNDIMAQELQLKQQDMEMRRQIEMARLKILYETKMMEIAAREKLSLEQLYSRLDLDQDKLNLDIMKELGRREEIKRDREEMQLKTIMGSGI